MTLVVAVVLALAIPVVAGIVAGWRRDGVWTAWAYESFPNGPHGPAQWSLEVVSLGAAALRPEQMSERPLRFVADTRIFVTGLSGAYKPGSSLPAVVTPAGADGYGLELGGFSLVQDDVIMVVGLSERRLPAWQMSPAPRWAPLLRTRKRKIPHPMMLCAAVPGLAWFLVLEILLVMTPIGFREWLTLGGPVVVGSAVGVALSPVVFRGCRALTARVRRVERAPLGSTGA